ncbi:MAG: DUF1788 domain-containing protein [Bacillota bacterium]
MGKIEDLASTYRNHIAAPWQRDLAGEQKTIIVVYPKSDERKLRARIPLFRLHTIEVGHTWSQVDISDAFAEWMSGLDYRSSFFERPSRLAMLLAERFVPFVAQRVRNALTRDDVDENTVVALIGAGCLYGFTHLSDVIASVKSDVRGRLLIFFPGEYENNNYRLLDARDGWNYLAVPITLHAGVDDK